MPSKPGLVVLVSHERTVSFSATRSKAYDTAAAHNFPALAPDISVDSRLSPVGDSGGDACETVLVEETCWTCKRMKKTPVCFMNINSFQPTQFQYAKQSLAPLSLFLTSVLLPICYPSNTVPHVFPPGILPVHEESHIRMSGKEGKYGSSYP